MLHNIETNLNDDVIYIPFTRDELCEQMVRNIQQFVENSAKNNKHYMVLFHGECNLSYLAQNAKIYVLGHGIDIRQPRKWSVVIADENLPYEALKYLPFYDWAYSITAGKKAISIDTVARRMIEDGILEADHLRIKLFFCDVNNKADIIAKRFLSHFKDSNNTFTIDYYFGHKLYNPNDLNGEIRKWAENAHTGKLVKASSIKQSLFTQPDKYYNDVESSQKAPLIKCFV